MSDNANTGLYLVIFLLIVLVAVIKIGLTSSAARRRPTVNRSDDVDSLSWDNWEPARHHHDNQDGSWDSSHSDSSHSDSSHSDSSHSDSSHGDGGSGGGDSSSD